MTITAKYEDGVFKPLENVTISEGAIVEVRVPSYAGRLKGKSWPVEDFAFFGMWKDRTDIGDSVEYISNLRRDLRSWEWSLTPFHALPDRLRCTDQHFARQARGMSLEVPVY